MSVRRFKRLFMVQLAALLTLRAAATPVNAAQIIGDGVRPAYDEAYYATTDYYGNLTKGSVVKSYALRGAASLTDYGDYEEVINLSDGSAPIRRGEEVIFQFGAEPPTHFYFEGQTKRPFENLPWTLSVHYLLNGVPTKAEDLSGKTGVVEIDADAIPNENASDYARYNYVLTAAAMFNQDDILSLEAPGAQTQLIGNLRAVLFMAFPGEEQHFQIRVGTDEFSFTGLTFMMVPATLSQIDEIAKLSEKKTDLEDSYHELSDSLDTALDAFNNMQGSLYETADGLDELEQARQTISGGKGSVYGDLDRVQADLETLSGALRPVTGHAENAQSFLTDARNAVNRLVDSTLQISGKLSGVEGSLQGLESSMGNLENGVRRMESGLTDIETGLAATEKSLVAVELALEDTASGVDDAASSLTAVDEGLVDLESGLEGMEGDLSATESGMGTLEERLETLEESLSTLESGMENLEGGLEELEGGLETLEGDSGDVKRLLEQASDLKISLSQLGDALDNAEISNSSSGTSGGSSLGVTQSDLDNVQQIGRLFNLTSEGETPNELAFYATMLQSQGYDEETAQAVAGLFVSGNEAAIEAQGLTEAYQTLRALYNVPTYQRFAAAILQQRGYSEADAATTSRQMEQLWTLYQTPEGYAALELLLSSAGNIDRTLNNATRTAGRTLDDVSSMAANVMWDLSDLCKRFDDLTGMVEDAKDVSGTLRGTLEDLRGLSEDLRGGSGDLRAASETLRGTSGDLRNLLSDLRGLSGDLRNTSADLRGASGSVQDSLRSLADLLESLVNTSARLRDTTSSLRATSATVRGVSADARDASEKVRGASAQLRELSATLRAVLADADALRNVMNAYEPSAQSALETLKSLTGVSTDAINDTNRLLASAESLLKRGGNQLDAGTRDTLRGLTSTIRKAADGLDTTKDLQSAKDTITDLIEDTWDDYTGDVNNLLQMDSSAEAQSLTSPRNGTPQSVQIIIRTQEIEADSNDSVTETVAASRKPTFFERLGQMFLDFWTAVTGVFRR